MCLSFSFTLPYTHSLHATLIKKWNKNNHEWSQFIIIAINAYNHLRWLFDRGLLVIIYTQCIWLVIFPRIYPNVTSINSAGFYATSLMVLNTFTEGMGTRKFFDTIPDSFNRVRGETWWNQNSYCRELSSISMTLILHARFHHSTYLDIAFTTRIQNYTEIVLH